MEEGGMPSDSDGPIRLVDIIAGMASRLRSIGEAILQTGVGFRNFLGQLLLDMGHSLRSFISDPFDRTPAMEEAHEGLGGRGEDRWPKAQVGNAVLIVAVAVLTLVLLKRAYIIRFV